MASRIAHDDTKWTDVLSNPPLGATNPFGLPYLGRHRVVKHVPFPCTSDPGTAAGEQDSGGRENRFIGIPNAIWSIPCAIAISIEEQLEAVGRIELTIDG